MRLQLREYDLVAGTRDEFVPIWRDVVVPLRERFGFEVVRAWLPDDVDRFIWIVGHPGDFEAAEQAYYSDSARTAMDPDPSVLVVGARIQMIRPLD